MIRNDLGVDCISRQALLNRTVKKNSIWNKITDSEGNNLETIISDLPSVTPQEPRWIPCSERMPEDHTNVLFCDIDGDVMLGYHIPREQKAHFVERGSWDMVKNVVAWMPLPESYKEVKDGN